MKEGDKVGFGPIVWACLGLWFVQAVVLGLWASSPLVGNYSMRAVTYAMMGEQWMLTPLQFFAPTTQVWIQGQPGLYLMDFPWPAYLAALAARLSGWRIEFWGRMLSFVLMPYLFAAMYRLMRVLKADPARSLRISAWLSLFPLTWVYFQSFQMESWALCGLLTSILFFYHLRSPAHRFRNGFIFVLSASLTLLLRPHWALCALVCLPELKSSFDGNKSAGWARLFGLSAAALALPAAWVVWSYYANAHYDHVYYSLAIHNERGGAFYTLWFDPAFYRNMLKFMVSIVIGPVGFAGLAAGFIFKEREDNRPLKTFFVLWGWASVAMVFLVAVKFNEANYYYMPLLPWLAYRVDRGYAALLSKIPFDLRRIAAGLFFAVLAGTSVFLAWRLIHYVPPTERFVEEAGIYADRHFDAQGKVIAAAGSSPSLVYYSRRGGWEMSLYGDNDTILKRFEECVSEGADYFVTVDVDRLKQTALWPLLHRVGTPLEINDRFAAFSLKEKRLR